ncbi:MAG: hypothetical protein [Circular genetic element sp.]|nr:MAG: hypothetical protein [Circular genetic element sp.]
MSANTLFYEGLTNGNQYYNLCRDLSWMNSKNHEHSDRDGHVVGYICNVKVMGDASNLVKFITAPNSWKLRNSFRKWHAYRELMFTEAGVTESEKGRYGKTIRPYLDVSMTSGTIKDPLGWNISGTPPVQTQEWTYTQIAAAPGFDQNAVGTEGAAAVDVYELTVCGLNQSTATTLGTQYYTSVGMIHSYNQDRQEVVTPTLDSQTIEGHNNPLALLKQGGAVSGGEVMDIVQDQELEAPPYDITDGGWSTNVYLADMMQINPGFDGTNLVPVLKTAQVFVPAGLLKINATDADSDAVVMIDVVAQVLCKDMA